MMRDTINLNKFYNSWLVQYDVYNYTLLILFLSYTLQITIYNLKQLLEKKQKKSSWLLLNLLFILMIDDKPFFITQREPFLHYIYIHIFFFMSDFSTVPSHHMSGVNNYFGLNGWAQKILQCWKWYVIMQLHLP